MMLKIDRLFAIGALVMMLIVPACARTTVETSQPTVPVIAPARDVATPEGEDVRVGTPAQTSRLSPQQLQEDLVVLRTTLEEAHPGLYTYVDKATRDVQFDALLERLDREMSDIAFYRLIAPLVVDIRDGHTAVWPAADSVVYTGEHATFLPFTLRFVEDRAFADAVHSPDAGLAPGSEVLAINGLAIADIVAQLLPYVPRDGFSETGASFLLSRAFPIYYAFGFDQAEGYTLSVRDRGTGEARTTEIRPLNAIEVGAFFEELTNPPQSLSLELLNEDAVALMTIGSFGDPGIATFLADSFRRLNELEIEELIIDLRGNGGGGNEPGGLLYAYLTDAPFRYYDHLGIVLDAPLTYLQHTDLSVSRLSEILAQTQEMSNGARQFPHWYGFDETLQNEPDAYTGKVYFLIDGGSGSSTAEFAAIAHHNRRGLFIGEETFGTYLSNNSGEMPTLTLPNSGIRVTIPLFQFVMAVSEAPFGRGVLPDHAIRPTVDDFLAGIDTELEYALDLIQQNQRAQQAEFAH
jgi:hypothetical protein